MPLIGTAGHVDHGKSSLIEALTGRDPDRWDEEKKRGLTIDLGFAWATLPDGSEVSFVDVPGHERFLKNMLAGIEAIDVALFVVAADEGWMPQSEEHLAVLDLLGVDRGVVALTKADLVDDELMEMAVLEIDAQLAGTSLADAPIVPVSSLTGEGIETLLGELVAKLPDDVVDNGRPRLWVDRSFPVSGAGTVVTGSLLDGSLTRDMTVETYPRGAGARVRSIQSHERVVDTVMPGRRVALNLGGVSHDEVGRGDMIGLPGQWLASSRFVASVTTARFVDHLDARGAYQIHIGSSPRLATITGMSEGIAVFTLDDEVPVAVGDRYILRDTGRHLVVAGGRVLDPAPGRTRRAMAATTDLDPDGTPDEVATRLLAIRSSDSVARLGAHSGGGRPTDAVIVGETALDKGWMEQLAGRAVSLVDQDHLTHPLRGGLPLATLAERLGVDPSVAEAIVDDSDTLIRSGPVVSLSGHTVSLDDEDEAAWQGAVSLLHSGLDVPSETELGLDGDVVGMKIRTGELVRVAPGLVYLPSQIATIVELIRDCGEDFTVADFRDRAGLSRKYAVPILEWSDREGLTIRRGDRRRIR